MYPLMLTLINKHNVSQHSYSVVLRKICNNLFNTLQILNTILNTINNVTITLFPAVCIHYLNVNA